MVTKNIHFNVLHPSEPDTVELGYAVEQRFLDLLSAYQRIHGEVLNIPIQLDRDILRWREMRIRHRGGDLQNTDSELTSTKVIAQWTLDVNAKLRNQKPVTIEWKD